MGPAVSTAWSHREFSVPFPGVWPASPDPSGLVLNSPSCQTPFSAQHLPHYWTHLLTKSLRVGLKAPTVSIPCPGQGLAHRTGPALQVCEEVFTSLVVRHTQMQTTMRCHLVPVTMANT